MTKKNVLLLMNITALIFILPIAFLLRLSLLNRLIDVQKPAEGIQDKIFYFPDMFIRDAYAKQAYS